MNKNNNIANFITVNEVSSKFQSIHKDRIFNEVYDLMKKENYDIYGVHDDFNKIIGYLCIDDYDFNINKINNIDLVLRQENGHFKFRVSY